MYIFSQIYKCNASYTHARQLKLKFYHKLSLKRPKSKNHRIHILQIYSILINTNPLICGMILLTTYFKELMHTNPNFIKGLITKFNVYIVKLVYANRGIHKTVNNQETQLLDTKLFENSSSLNAKNEIENAVFF